jgi:hypothetical protein
VPAATLPPLFFISISLVVFGGLRIIEINPVASGLFGTIQRRTRPYDDRSNMFVLSRLGRTEGHVIIAPSYR